MGQKSKGKTTRTLAERRALHTKVTCTRHGVMKNITFRNSEKCSKLFRGCGWWKGKVSISESRSEKYLGSD